MGSGVPWKYGNKLKSFDRLVAAIGYPSDEVLSENGVLQLLVDGEKIEVREGEGRLVLSRALGPFDDAGMQRMAGYASGRMLKEDAVLTWDPASDGLVLWQDVPSGASDGQLKRVFEVFCASCDWWLARAGEENAAGEQVPEMMIRP